MQVLHIGSIAAIKERGQSKSRIGVLAGHVNFLKGLRLLTGPVAGASESRQRTT
jgi:hypothetical protein